MKGFKWLLRVVAWTGLPALLWGGGVALFGTTGWGSVPLVIPAVVSLLLRGIPPIYAVVWSPSDAPVYLGLGFVVQGLLLERVAWGIARAVRAWRRRPLAP